ncbi:MAG: helix-turn-helix domain-containing protein [Clostridia bacterium]|nr:helix-turn-helix domain-containing protein [Clostridia bacterium]
MAKINTKVDGEVMNALRKEFEEKPNVYAKFFATMTDEQKTLIYGQLITSAFEEMMNNFELVSCVVAMMNHDLNVSETSRGAFLHRNTLIYRIDKIKKLTGLDIRKFEDATTFKTLMAVYYESKK